MIEDGAGGLGVEREEFAGDIGAFAGVGAAAHGDVGLHFFHAEQFDVAQEFGVGFVGAYEHFAGDAGVACFDQWNRAGGASGAHEGDGEIVGHVGDIYQDVLAFFEGGGVVDEQVGKFG